jgi:pimeloyl-ACP methyl ester carboxylesterase
LARISEKVGGPNQRISSNNFPLDRFEVQITIIDVPRNHGQSGHSPIMTYRAMVADVVGYIKEHNLDKVSLMGHSMVRFDSQNNLFAGWACIHANGITSSRLYH